MSRFFNWRTGLTMSLLALTLLGCAPRVDLQGHSVDLDTLAEVKVGESDKARVLALLGSPSTQSEFGQETWMYISKHTEQTAFFAPEVISQKVIYLSFDSNGIVDSIGTLDKNDGKKIEYVNRETETAGQKISFLQQLFGNIGRFNSDSSANTP